MCYSERARQVKREMKVEFYVGSRGYQQIVNGVTLEIQRTYLIKMNNSVTKEIKKNQICTHTMNNIYINILLFAVFQAYNVQIYYRGMCSSDLLIEFHLCQEKSQTNSEYPN